MRFLLANDYGNPAQGGTEVLLYQLRDQLRQRGHEVEVFTSNADLPTSGARPDHECFGTTSSFRTLLQSANPLAALALRKVLRTFRPDAVHLSLFLTQLSPLILPLLRDVPTIYHARWYRMICPRGTKMLPNGKSCGFRSGTACLKNGCLPIHDWVPLMLQGALARRWFGNFRAVLADSHWLKHRLEKEGIGPVQVVWNAADPVEQRAALSDPPLIGCAARFVPEKGVDVLLRSFAIARRSLPELRLILVGSGPEEASLRSLATELGLDGAIDWRGRMPKDQLQRELSPCWAQVAPSIWEEPFGVVAVDAMLRGSVAIAARSGGLGESIIEGKTGYLVAPRDPEDMARAIVRVCSDRAHAEELGAAGRIHALAHFTTQRMVDEIEAYLMRVAAGERLAA